MFFRVFFTLSLVGVFAQTSFAEQPKASSPEAAARTVPNARTSVAIPSVPDALKQAEKPVKGSEDKAENAKRAAPTKEKSSAFMKNNIGSRDAKIRADKLRLTALASMRKMMTQQKDMSENRKYELLLRSGEIYLERHDFVRELEIDAFTKKWDKWVAAGKKGKAPKASYATSKKQIDNGINIFKTLVKQYPLHPRTDSTLYALGTALTRLDNAEATKYFELLLKNHPKSPVKPDTYLALGEYYFDKHNIVEAIKNYKKVLAYKDHKAYIYAKYKLGWSYYNSPTGDELSQQKNWQMAAQEFKDVVRLSGTDKADQGKFSLREESLNDLVMVWADLNAVEIAWAYFRALDETEKFYNMLERLGWIYLEQGKYDRAVIVYERLIREAPLRLSSPKIHSRLLELYDRKNSTGQVVALLERMVDFYKPTSAWADTNRKEVDAVKEAREKLEGHVHRYGAMYHDRGQKSADSRYQLAGVRLYKLHLKEFPTSKNHIEIMYYLAELLYDLKRYDESSDYFYEVAVKSPADGKHKKKSADSMVDVGIEAVAAAKLPPVPKAGSIVNPMVIPTVQKKLVDRMTAFLGLYPVDVRAAKMRFSSAKIYFDYGHYGEAVKRYTEVAKVYPTTIEGRSSARIVLAYFNDKKDWKSAIAFSNQFLKTKDLMDKVLLDFTTNVLKVSMFELAVQYEKEKEYNKSAEQFLSFQAVFPKDPNADKAVYNGVINFYRAKNIDSALARSEFFLSLYPASTLRPAVMAKLAENYEKLVELPKASKYYYLFYKEFVNDPKRRDALFAAATLQKGVGAVQQSAAYFEEYIRMYPGTQEAVSAQFQIAEMFERNGDFTNAVAAYDKLAKVPKADVDLKYFAQTKSAMISYRNLNRNYARATLDSIGSTLIKEKQVNAYRSREMIAKLWFDSLEPRFNNYQKVEILNSLKIEAELLSKQALLTGLVNDYKRVIELRNSEFMAASLYRVGEMHENFAQVLTSARVPAGFSEEETKDFRSQIEQVAKPLRDQASKFYAQAMERTKEIDAYSTWVKTINDRMAKIDTKKYKAVDEESSEPLYLGHYFKSPTVLQRLVNK